MNNKSELLELRIYEYLKTLKQKRILFNPITIVTNQLSKASC